MTKSELIEELKDVGDDTEIFVEAEGFASPVYEVQIYEDANRAIIVAED